MTDINIEEFTTQIAQVEKQMRKKVRQFPEKIGYPLIRDLARKTPNRGLGFGKTKAGVPWYSGRAAANWFVSTSPSASFPWRIPFSADAVANAKATADDAKSILRDIGWSGTRDWYISNPVFYIYYLNRGWSKKARPNYINFIVEAHQRRAMRFAEKWFDPSTYIKGDTDNPTFRRGFYRVVDEAT